MHGLERSALDSAPRPRPPIREVLVHTLTAFGSYAAFERQERRLLGQEANVLVGGACRARSPGKYNSDRMPWVGDQNVLAVLKMSRLCRRKAALQQQHYFS
jgi:hypothetical protein